MVRGMLGCSMVCLLFDYRTQVPLDETLELRSKLAINVVRSPRRCMWPDRWLLGYGS